MPYTDRSVYGRIKPLGGYTDTQGDEPITKAAGGRLSEEGCFEYYVMFNTAYEYASIHTSNVSLFVQYTE